jgi:flagellar FliJ protein
MKRFEFKLQAVLTLRQRAEQLALESYSRALQSRQAAADRLAELERELSESRRQWLNALADGCPAAQAVQLQDFCHALEARGKEREKALHLADVELNQASQRLLLARQQREAIERYLERQRADYEQRLRIEERKLIDDLVGRRPAPVSFSGRAPNPGTWN